MHGLRVLFTSAPVFAHLDWGGFLATASELQRRGHQVLWASGGDVEAAVRGAGVDFARVSETGWRWPPPPPLTRSEFVDDAAFQRQRALRSMDQWLDPIRVAAAVEALDPIVAHFHPDVIVGEVFSLAAALCAERAGTPFVVAGWPAHPPATATAPFEDDARARLNSVLARFGLRGANVTVQGLPAVLSPHLHLTWWCDSWYRGANLLPQTRHCGGRAPAPEKPPAEFPSADDRPWIWITLGTTFTSDSDFFRMATQAVHKMGCLPIVSTGGVESDPAWKDAAPAGTVIGDRIEFARVLPLTSAAVHHGGAGTTHGLVLHAVPQIIVPRAGDQMRQAVGVQRARVGLALAPRELTTARLVEALAALLPDRSAQRAAAIALRDEMAALGGPPCSADWIEKLVRDGSV